MMHVTMSAQSCAQIDFPNDARACDCEPTHTRSHKFQSIPHRTPPQRLHKLYPVYAQYLYNTICSFMLRVHALLLHPCERAYRVCVCECACVLLLTTFPTIRVCTQMAKLSPHFPGKVGSSRTTL